MGFFSRMWAGVVGAAPRPNPDDERLWSQGGVSPDFSRAGTYVSDETIQQLDAVAAVLLAIAGPLSTLPIGIFEKKQEEADALSLPPGAPAPEPGAPETYNQLVADHPVARLLNLRPNERQTASEFRDEQLRHLAVWRNSYVIITPDRATGDVASLELVHPSRVALVEKRYDGKIVYTINNIGEVGSVTYSADLIWHVRMAPLTRDGLRGRPIFETSREVFGRALAVKNYGADWFRNSGQSGGIIEHPGSFKSKEDQDKFLAGWRNQSTGSNRHRDRMLQMGVKYTPVTVTNDSAQFNETDRESALAICRLWTMPPHRAGILDRATFSNIEQQSLDCVVYTYAPFISAIEQSIWRDLIIGRGEQDRLVVEINLAGLLRGDILTRFKAYAIGRQWGWLSVNDILRAENKRPIEGGDRYLEPTNMTKAGENGSDGINDSSGAPGGQNSGENNA